jgi:hypothetical protein
MKNVLSRIHIILVRFFVVRMNTGLNRDNENRTLIL